MFPYSTQPLALCREITFTQLQNESLQLLTGGKLDSVKRWRACMCECEWGWAKGRKKDMGLCFPVKEHERLRQLIRSSPRTTAELIPSSPREARKVCTVLIWKKISQSVKAVECDWVDDDAGRKRFSIGLVILLPQSQIRKHKSSYVTFEHILLGFCLTDFHKEVHNCEAEGSWYIMCRILWMWKKKNWKHVADGALVTWDT